MRKIFFLLVIFLVSITPITYIPNIPKSLGNYEIYLLGITFVLSFFYKTFIIKEKPSNLLLLLLLLSIFITSIEFLIFYAGNFNYETSDLISIIVAYSAIYIGYSFSFFSLNQLKSIIFVFCLSSIIMAIICIKEYVGIFSVNVPDYLVKGKNQVGQLISQSAIISFCMFLKSKEIKTRGLFLVFFLISFFFLFIVKCKTAAIATVFIVLFLIYKLSSTNVKKKYLLFGIPSILLFFFIYQTEITTNMINVLGLEGKIGIEDLTAGRASRNTMAIDYILDNPILGELLHYSNIPWIHNWLLLRIVRYGFFSIPFLIFYFSIIICVLKNILNIMVWNIYNIGILLFLVPYISSFLEPEAPFTTISMLIYLMFGISLKYMSSNSKIISNELH